MQAEDFFPMGWLEKPFRRQPYPDMTYGLALATARAIAQDIISTDAEKVYQDLDRVITRMQVDHAQFEGRSMQPVSEFGKLWRGKVITLLKTSEGTK